MIGLTEITKNIFKKNKTSGKHKPSSPALCAEQVGYIFSRLIPLTLSDYRVG